MSYFGYVVKSINENEFKGVYEEIDIPKIKIQLPFGIYLNQQTLSSYEPGIRFVTFLS